MKGKKIVAGLIATALMLSLCACNDKSTGKKEDIDLSKYPINTDVKLTYWLELNGNLSATAANFGDTEFAKGLKERTGVSIEYLHPAAGQGAQTFNLLIASGEFPDIMQYNWTNAIAGGPDAAIGNEVIIPLNDLMENYAPNLTKYLSENPDIDKLVKSNEGNYYVFPFVRGDDILLNSSGTIVRTDWLEELGLDMPETLEDWENMLRMFRDKKGATAPLAVSAGWYEYLYSLVGTSSKFYLEDGKVVYGPLTQGFKDGIEVLARWYDEGLIDKNYVIADGKATESNILNGLSGACFGNGGAKLGTWIKAKEGQKFDLRAVTVPKINGKANKFGIVGVEQYNGASSVAITTSCDYPELAAKYLDYLYGEEGHMYANFGTEGVSYEMIDGYPTYTDLILDNEEGLPASQVMPRHFVASSGGGAFVQDRRYIEQYYELDQQKEALEIWTSQKKDSGDTWLPTLTLTLEESSEYSKIYTDIKKYCDENVISFITGEKPLSEYDKFVKQIEKMGIERAIKIQQTAYERYMNR